MKIVTLIAAFILLSGCGSFGEPETFGDALIEHSAETRELGEDWKDSVEQIEDGQAMVKRGQETLKDSKKMMEKGEDQIIRGNRMIKDGMKRKRQIESMLQLNK